MLQGAVQVVVDVVGRQVGRLPWQTLGQNQELLQVAGAPANPTPVGTCELGNAHTEYSQRAGEYSQEDALCTPLKNRYKRTNGQLAQLYSWVLCLASFYRQPIIRGLWLTLLCVCIFLHRIESALGLLALGQLAEAIKEFRSGRRP
jgi:hypothetical protein